MKRLNLLCMGLTLMSSTLFADQIFTDSFEYNDWPEAVAAGWEAAYGNVETEVSFVNSAPNNDGVTDGAKALKIDVPGGGANLGIIHPFSSELQREWTLSFDWYLTGTSTGELPETGMRTQVKVKSSANNDEVGFWVQYNNDGGGVYPRTLDFIVNTTTGSTGWVRIDKLYNSGDHTIGDFPLAMKNGWNHIELSSAVQGDQDLITVIVNDIEIYTTTGEYAIAMDEVLFGYWHYAYADRDGYFDNVKIGSGALKGAHNPIPGIGDTGVLTTDSLVWEAGLDPNDLTMVNPQIKKHYVWLSSGSETDPNMTLVDTINVTDYTDPANGCIYTPAAELKYDSTYYWMVEEGLDNGSGGVYPAGNDNNIAMSLWSFRTIATVPEILLQPGSVKVDPASTVEFDVEYLSNSAVSDVTWYKNDMPLTSGGNVSIVWDQDSSTLTIENVSSNDDGDYYAVVTNSADAVPSDTVKLVTNKLLAWYQFEQNADDSAGTNSGTEENGMTYVAGNVTDDGQVYAADPNGTDYILLSKDAYPKAGLGNGLEEFTYSCWVSLEEGEGGILLGVFNEGATTGMRFSINSVENDISVFMRQENGASIHPATSPLAADGHWHYVVTTYDGTDMKIYVDGILKSTVTNQLTDFAEWQYPMPLVGLNYHGSINDRFNGKIDDLKIYNYAISKAEVIQEYLAVEGGWICNDEQPDLIYDFDNNCQVDLGDFAIFAGYWLDSNRIYAE